MDTQTILLNENWKFKLADCGEAWYKGYDDSSWESISLPHDWSVTLPFSPEYSSGTGYAAGGIGWYRGRFSLPEEYRGKCVRIVFDGVYKNSQVFVNSYHLGKRPNGYVSFSYDLTPFVRFGGEENQISVKVTHTDLADSRWFTGSGIYRKVYLLIEEPVHPKEHGIVFQVKKAAAGEGIYRVTHTVCNTGETAREVTVTTALYDQHGQLAAATDTNVSLTAGEEQTFTVEEKVDHPSRWSPESPALYVLKSYYRTPDTGKYLVDATRVGFRSLRFDPDTGFYLNGQPTKLKGVCLHHDAGALGAAATKEVWHRRLLALKEAGCNAIRGSHNPHMPELYDLCDELGFLMIDEAFDEWENAKNKWWQGHNVYPPKHEGYAEEFPVWHDADLRAMVRRDRNHPSVFMWSIGNEIDYPNDPYCHPMFEAMTGNNDKNKPAEEMRYRPDKPNAERLAVLAADLARIVREEDQERPVSLAAAFPEMTSHLGYFDHLDVVGYNYKEHLYQEDHRRFPDKPLLGSENSHRYEAWLAVRDNDFISGQFLWTGIDYLGESRGEWPIHGSAAGFLTCAGFKKSEFYRRQSFWLEQPVLHLAVRRSGGDFLHTWNGQAGETVEVAAFTNLAKVVLYVNEKEIGGDLQQFNHGAVTWQIPFAKGMIRAVGYNQAGEIVAADSLKTAAAADCLKVSEYLDGCPREKGYLHQLEVCLMDDQGQPAIGFDREINVDLSGPGELKGMENGDLADLTPFTCGSRKTYHGNLVIFVRRRGPGEIRVNLSAPEMNEQEITLTQ